MNTAELEERITIIRNTRNTAVAEAETKFREREKIARVAYTWETENAEINYLTSMLLLEAELISNRK